MMYLSKGVRVPSNDAGLFCVSHRGTTFPMGMQMSALWRNARNRPRPVPVGKEGPCCDWLKRVWLPSLMRRVT